MQSAVSDLNAGLGEKPTQFGQYKVVRELGRGGMACVFEGRHPQLGSRVALKVMTPALAAQPLAASRFLREAKAASQIHHQNVVEVFDIGTQDGVPFIVMEFLDGVDLATLLAQKGALPLAGLVDVFLPVISAVATAHRAGIVHRDLKPANLMLTQRAPLGTHPVVLDFGISKIVDDDVDRPLTGSESLLGTVQYMAPELTKGARLASAASDQYAIGVMLYECATGKRPFTGASHYELMHAIVTAPVAPPSKLVPALPPEFDEIVRRAMHRDPEARFPSLEALGSALLSFGNKAAWTLWEKEFVNPLDGAQSDPWSADSGTLSDGLPQARGIRSSGRRWQRWALLPVVAYAAMVTLLLARRSSESDRPVPVPPVISAATLLEMKPVATERVADNAMANLTVKPAPEGSSPAHDVAFEEVHDSKPARRPTATKPLPVAPAPDTLAVSHDSPSPKPVPTLGTNGAPIVE